MDIGVNNVTDNVLYMDVLTSSHEDSKKDAGFIMSKDDVIKIKEYVKFSSLLQLKKESVIQWLGVKDRTYISGAEPEDVTALHQSINSHGKTWSNIESTTIKVSADLNSFSKKLITTCEKIINGIDQMNIYDQTDTLLETKDKKVLKLYSDLLTTLKPDVEAHLKMTNALIGNISDFKDKIDNKLLPESSHISGLFDGDRMSSSEKELLESKVRLEAEIKQLRLQYDQYVEKTVSGIGDLAKGPFGFISGVVKFGMFGDKAEKTRKEKNKKIKELKKIQDQLKATQVLLSHITKIETHFINIDEHLTNASTSAELLKHFWIHTDYMIETSLAELNKIDNKESLGVYQQHVKNVSDNWEGIQSDNADLNNLFSEAIEEFKTSEEEELLESQVS